MTELAAEVWQFVLAGLVVGGIFALIAAGFVLVYQVSGIINFAQGEFAMIGAMTSSSLYAHGWPIPLAALAAVAAAAVVGGVAQYAALRPARHYGTVTLIFITLGLDVAIRGAALFVWGTNPLLLPAFTGGTSLAIFGGTIPPQAMWVFATDLALVLALYAFFRRTYLGAAVRAAMVNPGIARVFGMPLGAFSFWSFVAAAAIGAIGGIVIAPITSASYDMGLSLGLNGFVAAILGGLDSLPGALIGGFVLGIVEKLSGGFLASAWEQGIAFVILLAVLVARPQGLLGRAARRA
ncbi:MAG: branched-chain amino acid ABC transporter permease [Candidatus Eremiobacteraeota bacterium]|nr:branched-chain amino acid ABC transporter permease [Candidatus Eremiobacteraeota bacterium]